MGGIDVAHNETLRSETYVEYGYKVLFSSLMSVKLSCNNALGGPVLLFELISWKDFC